MRTTTLCAVLIIFLTACTSGAQQTPNGYPPTADGARQLVTDLRTKDADSIVKELAPTDADCRAVFEGDLAIKAATYYSKRFADFTLGPVAKPDQTELEFWAASSEDLKAHVGEAVNFPGGYKRVAPLLKQGLTFYRWKYVVPGSDSGMAYDGLTYVNSRWIWLPKPWLMMDSSS